MCSEFVKWLPQCDDWRPHIKCLGQVNLVRFVRTRWDYLEKDDFIRTLWQWHATFQVVTREILEADMERIYKF